MDSHVVSMGLGSLTDWMHAAGGLPSMVFFSEIKNYLDESIMMFEKRLLGRVGEIIGAIAAMVVTVWIIIQGFRIATGQSREPMMALVVNSLRAVLIVGVATGVALTPDSSYKALTDGLAVVVRDAVTGRVELEDGRPDDGPYGDIDEVLAVMQAGMMLVQSIDTADDPTTEGTKSKAMTMIGVGLGGPAVMATVAMLLNKIAMALFIGTGPFFILCLLFDQTKALFQKWLYYGIATMMTMAVLTVMVTIAMDLVFVVGAAFWIPSVIPGLGGSPPESVMAMALQQGGLGFVMSALILAAPPMAGAFFNGVMGQFHGANYFSGDQLVGKQANQAAQPGTPGYVPQSAPVAQGRYEGQTNQGRVMK